MEFKFSESDIEDTFDLCKRLMNLPLDQLKSVFEYVTAEVARVKIELEIPSKAGEFATTVFDFVEPIPKPQLGTSGAFVANRTAEDEYFEVATDDALKELKAFSNRLSKLPRITREFFAVLLERRDEGSDDRSEISYDKLKRIVNWKDIDGELRLLEAEGLVGIEEPEAGFSDRRVVKIFIKGALHPGPYDDFHCDFLKFVKSKSLSFRKTVGIVDFSNF